MKVLLLRFGELYLKGNNRNIFENLLITNIKKKLEGESFSFEKTFGRYLITNYDEEREDKIIEKLKQVFGLYSLSRALEVEAELDVIKKEVSKYNIGDKSFKVFVKRADKQFPLSSMDLAKELGEIILKNNTHASVDLYNPQIEINIDIRLNKKAYIFTDIIKCRGGLPLGSAGKGLLLLSGGIDSPVAGYLVAKRGLELEA